MDLSKFTYNDIDENVLKRLFEEGKDVISIGTYDDYLKLPKVEFVDELKTDYEIKNDGEKVGVEEQKE